MLIEYNDYIEKINTGLITFSKFKVIGYSHFKECIIERKIHFINEKTKINLISVKLSDNIRDKISFLNKFKEKEKIFYMGRKGSFTLKEIWDKIEFIEIR